ncbi:MAG: high-affinity branched-chain amino acid ABC transporter ATP-binding protein LivG [Deltaproteobacteria bacterium GWC2_65_14]|nr:MAG: high-affinity branched-chain amino acid ABC transporter ATP-binding protein LivG [Deltaproteobacteria bacterium GWC2_65_14]
MILEVRGLTRHFGGIRALDGIDLGISAGELVGLIGPNGSGKTTLFNVVTGIYRPDRGEVLLEGEDIAGLPPHRINHLGVARTFQNIRLFRNLSVLDNVRVAYHRHIPYGPLSAVSRTGKFLRGERELLDRAQQLLSIVGLEDRKEELAAGLAYGAQRRLEIARALASGPKVLLLDEPAAGMNPYEVGRLKEFLLEIRERFRLTVLLIEHQMSLVMSLCERIAVMDFGQLIARGSPGEIRKNPAVIEAYLGESIPANGAEG